MTHGQEVAFDRENSLVLHEGDADWHPWLDPEPWRCVTEEHGAGCRFATQVKQSFVLDPRPGYSQNREDYA